ncbi:hypothetical protein B0H14DRAFT_3424448 [Mycena olivaceomarginata]|nr:hypothetical protein B0H14DRAFT_3424448 [Mycena olivaceomarginata]
MVFSKIFAPLFAIVLAAAVNATPAASPEANASSDIAKRTPGNVYLCDSTGWGLPCITEPAADTCVNLPTAPTNWQDRIQSFGPDQGATCYGYPDVGCGGEEWGPFTYRGDSTAGWPTLRPWGLAIKSICCDINKHTCPHGGRGGSGQCPGPTPYTGHATYYYPNGNYGACGWMINNGDMAVALGPDHWDSGAH